MTRHGRAEMACSPRRCGGARFRQYPAVDHREFRSASVPLYRETLVRAIAELAKGPDVRGSKVRDEIVPGLRSLHVARHGRRGRHFLLYRVAGDRLIEIARILYDGMDLQRHVSIPGEDGDG